MSSVKCVIPPFYGQSSPDEYITWVTKVDMAFSHHDYMEYKQMRMALLEFHDYALTWWQEFLRGQRQYNGVPIRTWTGLKEVMRMRFVPTHYIRELHTRLQRLVQGSISVDDYYKQMQFLLGRLEYQEGTEATMARFVRGLNRDIADKIELYPYTTLEELVHLAVRVEQQRRYRQLNKHSAPPPTGSTSTSES